MGKILEGTISPTFIWDLPVCEDFIEQNAIGPDIGFEGVGAVVGCLRGCPFHWDFGAAAGGINVILKNKGRQCLRACKMSTAAAFRALPWRPWEGVNR